MINDFTIKKKSSKDYIINHLRILTEYSIVSSLQQFQ